MFAGTLAADYSDRGGTGIDGGDCIVCIDVSAMNSFMLKQ